MNAAYVWLEGCAHPIAGIVNRQRILVDLSGTIECVIRVAGNNLHIVSLHVGKNKSCLKDAII